MPALSENNTRKLWMAKGIKPPRPYLFKLMTRKKTVELIQMCEALANSQHSSETLNTSHINT